MNSSTQISILGCGWLGLPLAAHLIAQGYRVKGSTTGSDKTALLNEKGIQPYQIKLSPDKATGDIPGFLENSSVLIINIPPGLRKNPGSNYPKTLSHLVAPLQRSAVSRVIFVSSTRVFPDHNTVFTELDTPVPDSQAGQQLLQAEELILQVPEVRTMVLRLGGLIGPDRHPVHFLSGRTNIQNGSHPVNLIHLMDAISLTSHLIQTESGNKTFHGVAPQHPEKSVYYTNAALRFQLPPPSFSEESLPTGGKTISSALTCKELGFTFAHPLP